LSAHDVRLKPDLRLSRFNDPHRAAANLVDNLEILAFREQK
jgi:hypothetical protein